MAVEDGQQVWVEGFLTIRVAPPEPEPEPPTATWEFRGVFARDEDFTACYAVLDTMGLNSIEVAAFSGSSNTQITKRLDQIFDPHTGWILFGSGFVPSSSGGSFGITDSKLDALMTNGGMGELVAEHPRNSHRYQIADEINLTGYTGSALQANLDTIKRRVDRVKTHDPLAVVGSTDYRQAQLDPFSEPGAIWAGVLDEVWLDGYPNWDPYQENFIPDQAEWCEEAGIPYVAVTSCHEYETSKPAYPTPDEFDHMVDQWAQTNARAFALYVWDDGSGESLADDPDMQAHIGSKMATVP